jgi:thiol-disulfide isomerase/thioredoxin
MKKVLLIGSIALIAIFVGRYIYHIPEFKIGATVPNIETKIINGKDFNLHEFAKDKVVLIEFWGSWCVPCRASNKKLVKVYNKYKTKKFKDFETFEIVSIGIEQGEGNWKGAIMQDQLQWQYQILQDEMFDSELVKLYGITEIPSNYLIDSKGKIIGVNMTDQQFKKYLVDHLQQGK